GLAHRRRGRASDGPRPSRRRSGLRRGEHDPRAHGARRAAARRRPLPPGIRRRLRHHTRLDADPRRVARSRLLHRRRPERPRVKGRPCRQSVWRTACMAEWSRIHGDSLTAPRMNRDSVTSLGSGRANYNGVVPLIERIERAHAAIVYGLLAVLLAAVFVPMSLLRLVDGDEGTYLLVSRLVVDGQVPYHDFFYPQMILLPYV